MSSSRSSLTFCRFDHDPRWAETGDRYLIKLFRDFVFHQVDENGRPVTDLSHVVTCLNKVSVTVCLAALILETGQESHRRARG